mmetsp:Transcript_7043/g.14136  ORF Transcript_7043/g.14136 Transcript_7043/m.14136 type:complete len:671 (-) Transcript_7043:96-2108(-)|eukprot:CAMPEP_0171491642 /NCGR_PEP_ID=MMETSP0958-20121227/3969_1 /TAXON_ID=87120 /ORGANISM="Aurantiochytrium limacinum, Strain ATCCMYA-1381" /LENGTH=670 /DNA_ID=CAMNT_0012025075 /DNA_START=1406 /DNA_END=3418 /DNA_ORIENTATION=-
MASISLPPFLKKLQEISKSCDPSIAGWSDDGKRFVVKSDRFEIEVVSKFFKGTLGTFIRQLHFYGFKKSDHVGEEWSFEHPKFERDFPASIYDIRRKTRQDKESAASKSEVRALRHEVHDLRREMDEMRSFMQDMKGQLDLLLRAGVGSAGGIGNNGGGNKGNNISNAKGATAGGAQGRSHNLLQILQQQAAASQPLPTRMGSMDSGKDHMNNSSAYQHENNNSAPNPPHARSHQHQSQHQNRHGAPLHQSRPSSRPQQQQQQNSNLSTSNKRTRHDHNTESRGAPKRTRDDSSSLSSSSRSNDFEPSYLPFQDGTNPGLDELEMDIPQEDDEFDAMKKFKEVGPVFDAAGLEDFSDLFLGMDDDFSLLPSMDSQDVRGPETSRSQQSFSSSSSSSSSSSVAGKHMREPRSVSGASTPSVAVSQGHEGEERIVVKNPMCPVFKEASQRYECRILVRKSATREVQLPNEHFAGFMSKFVEQAMLLHKRNMLTGDIDPELEIFVHASLPSESPLKDMLIYATPYVRTVLVNVLTDISLGDWQSSVDHALGPYAEKQDGTFLARTFLSFNFGNVRKEVDGDSFMQFMAFILKAAVNDDPRASMPEIDEIHSPFLRAFSQYFKPDVQRVMATAQMKFHEYKMNLMLQKEGKRGLDHPGKCPHALPSSYNSRSAA